MASVWKCLVPLTAHIQNVFWLNTGNVWTSSVIFILWASSHRMFLWKLSKVKQSVILKGGVDDGQWTVSSIVKAAEEGPVSGSGNTSGGESPENQFKTWGSAFRTSSAEEFRQCAMGNLSKLIFLHQMHHILEVSKVVQIGSCFACIKSHAFSI